MFFLKQTADNPLGYWVVLDWLDSAVANDYRVTAVPTSLFVDRTGVIRGSWFEAQKTTLNPRAWVRGRSLWVLSA